MAISDKPGVSSAALDDIPAQLRRLADLIEMGKHGTVHSLIILMPREQDYPVTMVFGKADGACEPIVQFDLARHWHIKACAGVGM